MMYDYDCGDYDVYDVYDVYDYDCDDVYDVYDDSRRYSNDNNTSTSDIMKEWYYLMSMCAWCERVTLSLVSFRDLNEL